VGVPARKHVADLIRSPWDQPFLDLLSSVESNLLLVSPFVKTQPAKRIISELARRGVREQVRVIGLTNLRPESALSGAMDLEALVELGNSLPLFELTHLPGLHAKVYVADDKSAVITSANLTEPGISGNLEYGVALTEPDLVRQVRRDFENYARLGARVLLADVELLLNETKELKLLFKAAERSIHRRARRAFQEKLKSTQNELLRRRARGRTTQSMLCEAILFALAKGPLRTEELHPLVQQLQPDLCDDSIDRVIDGVHFGKKWKHHVRSAQQRLKRDGRIRYDGELWHLVSDGMQ
jgi:phosphatidylserine/phosphatidylglycerophosphate/cardiolipin synthase-like enzyme